MHKDCTLKMKPQCRSNRRRSIYNSAYARIGNNSLLSNDEKKKALVDASKKIAEELSLED